MNQLIIFQKISEFTINSVLLYRMVRNSIKLVRGAAVGLEVGDVVGDDVVGFGVGDVVGDDVVGFGVGLSVTVSKFIKKIISTFEKRKLEWY